MRRLLPLLLLVLAACGDDPAPAEPPSPYARVARRVMGTEAQILVYAPGDPQAAEAAEKAFQELERLEKVLSDYDPESELMRLCAADHTDPVPVSRDLYDALTLALTLAARTRGLYDPTVGAYTHLWREAKAKGTRPTAEALAAAKDRVGWQKVEMHPPTRSVRFRVQGLQLDLGGFGKGYAAQMAWGLLGMAGYRSVLVDVGGDMVVGSPPEEQTGWIVGTPLGPMLTVRDCAVASSGPGDRAVTVGDTTYGHILDPRTGEGVTNGQSSIVIAPDATSADAFATVLCILPRTEGIATAEGTDGVEAGVSMQGGGIEMTSGFSRVTNR